MPRTGRPRERFECAVEGCDRKHFARGFCKPHYYRARRTGSPGVAEIQRRQSNQGLDCSVPACDRESITRGFCDAHYQQWKTHGTAGDHAIGQKRRPGTGGRWVDNHGYVILTLLESESWRRISEHRYVMEQHLGRPLAPDESVHHKNGNKQDNRLANLELWSRYQPAGQRVEDKLEWAREILRRYA